MVAAGCALLALRPLFVPRWGVPALVTVFAVLLVFARLPTQSSTRRARTETIPVLLLGVCAFAAGRLVGGGHAPQPLVLRVVALESLAAVAEEAFFRRFVYDALLPNGAAVAVAGSALLFALVHVSVYGFWVLPIDLGAGLLLSWQRWATGSWTVPAGTHVLANLLVVM